MAHPFFQAYENWKTSEVERKAKGLGYIYRLPEPKPATKRLKHPDAYGSERQNISGVDAINFDFFIDYQAELETVPERFRYSIDKKIRIDARRDGSFIWAAFRYFHEEYQALCALTEEEISMIDFSDTDIIDEAKRLSAIARGKMEWRCGIQIFPTSLKERIELLKQSDEKYWRRKLRKKVGRLTVHVSNLLGLVGKDAPHRITTPAVKKRFIDMQRRAERFKNETMLVAQDGETIRLSDIATTYDQRFAESLCIIDGLEDKALANGDTWSFITITLPPRFHPNPIAGRRSWNLVSVADSASYLTDGWRKIRAMLDKSKTDVCGIRVAEAHEDGCFHSHILMFHAKTDFERIKSAVKFQFSESDIQAKIEQCNGKAKASSYAFKYIQKATPIYDVNGISSTITPSLEDKDKVLANQALRSACGVRSLAWFGIPKGILTKWRLMGRCRSKAKEISLLVELVNARQFWLFIKEAATASLLKKTVVNAYGEASQRVCGLWFNGYTWTKKQFRLERIKSEVALNQNHPRNPVAGPVFSPLDLLMGALPAPPPPHASV